MAQDMKNEEKGERIAKLLARAGVGSRRDVERMIEAGRISLKGQVLETPAVLLHNLDDIRVDGEKIEDARPVTLMWRFHKPKGVITTHHDPQGRRTVFDLLPKEHGHLISVGRLDLNSEGLLLITNDGELARYLEHPSTELTRRYRVRVHGRVKEAALEALKNGIEVEGVRYGSIEASLERQQGSNAWLNVALQEGKNREIRKVFAALELPVTRLIRTSYGPFNLGPLKRGDLQAIPVKEWGKVARPIVDKLRLDTPLAPKRKRKGWAKTKTTPQKKRPPVRNKTSSVNHKTGSHRK